MSTRERILDTALGLFNEAGTAAISTNHIAEALGISPGNLYYHFRNKEAIIRAIGARLFGEWDVRLSLPDDRVPTVDALKGLVHTNFQIMWAYRFLYRELLALLRRDAEFQSQFVAVRQRGFADFQQLFAAFVAVGVLRAPDDPAAVGRVAELCWLVSEFWLPSVEAGGQAVTELHLQHGVALLMQVLDPFIVPPAPTPGEV